MNEWFGPAVTGAVVSGLITVIGWYSTYWSSRLVEREKRSDKVRDFMLAIGSEVQTNNDRFLGVDLKAQSEQIIAKIAADEAFTPFVPRYSSAMILDELIDEIYLLPNGIVSPLVFYYKQEKFIEMFVEDIRGPGYAKLPMESKIAVYRDYTDLIINVRERGASLIDALNDALTAQPAANDSISRLRATRLVRYRAYRLRKTIVRLLKHVAHPRS